VSGFGPRLLAFLVDAIAANLVVGLVGLGGWHPGQWRGWLVLAAFLAIELIFVAAAGQTPGMLVAGVAVVRVGTGQRAAAGWVLVRTLLLATILPAVLVDASGRALHDRAAGTVTIRVR
jgi:uncharacterized RDD family membrane protein YckC